jgi:putative two-component system response regulator
LNRSILQRVKIEKHVGTGGGEPGSDDDPLALLICRIPARRILILFQGRHMSTSEPAKILVVDDEPYICELISRWLRSEGHECTSASSAEMAIDLLEEQVFHLVVTDIMMPGMSGLELLTLIRKKYPDVVVVMVTAVDDRKTGILALELGAYGYVIKPFEKNEVLINIANALQRRQVAKLSQQYDRHLAEHVEQNVTQTRQRERLLLKVIAAVGSRHGETEAHILRVGRYSSVLAEVRGAGWTMKQCEDIGFAASMHDIGKTSIPDNILLKPGDLTREEREVMEKHTQLGQALLQVSDDPLFLMAREIALFHHEKWDGSGYPHGLVGEAIPEWARIVAVCDVFDALTHRRVYREALTESAALAVMMTMKGRSFDPVTFDAFLETLPKIRQIQQELVDEDWHRDESLYVQNV